MQWRCEQGVALSVSLSGECQASRLFCCFFWKAQRIIRRMRSLSLSLSLSLSIVEIRSCAPNYQYTMAQRTETTVDERSLTRCV